MIAADSSSLIAYFAGLTGVDVDVIDQSLAGNQLYLPPVVLTELLSDPKLPQQLSSALRHVPLLDLKPGFWERAGRLRATIIARKRRARLADTLIAQACLDNDVMLITRDSDFRWFGQVAGLKLAVS